MFNFLDPKLLPKVICKSPAMDNYEVENLINPNMAIRARGFLAYTVIKPPVEIEFELLCPVDIAYIALNTTIGNQRCTGIEIFAKSTQYHSLSKAVFDRSGVVFCDSRKYTKDQPPEPCCGDGDEKALFFFKKDTIRCFTNTTSIKVVIFRTNYTVPCLGSIQIVGQPAKTCSKSTIETINKLMGFVKTDPQQLPEVKSRNFQIPDDFIDDLTCEMMALPMTLPSGNTIDKETLEKYIVNEAKFGRKPGDPFTGLKFSDNRKAILNVALKSRIDMFLLHNSQNPATYNLKRTVASSFDNNKRLKHSNKCINCDNNNNILYSLPCKHYYCRNCLIDSDRILCKTCDKQFEKNEINRYYSV